jgi:hypothetical protein
MVGILGRYQRIRIASKLLAERSRMLVTDFPAEARQYMICAAQNDD